MLAALIRNHGKLWHSTPRVGAFQRGPSPFTLYFGHRIGPQGPLTPPSLHLHLTNCTLSHNTLSAFNYCLDVSGLKATHSIGSLCVHVYAVSRLKCAVCPLYDGWSIEGSAEFHSTLSPCSSRITHHWPVTTSDPQTCFRSANGLKRATRKHRECVGAVTGSV